MSLYLGENLISGATVQEVMNLNLFDIVSKDHVLSFTESKGLAQLGTYVYKNAVAGSRYGYETFYEKCLEEYQNPANTKYAYRNNVTYNGTSVKADNGVLSGFAASNYAIIPTITPGNSSWEIQFAFTTTSDVTTLQYIFGSSSSTVTSLNLYVKDNSIRMDIGNGGSSWQSTDVTGNVTIVPASYLVNITFSGTQYLLKVSSDDGETWTENGSYTSSTAIGTFDAKIGLARAGNSSPFLGTIDLKKCFINVAGTRVWTGADTVSVNPNGHMFYDISDKSNVDALYADKGAAWFYGIDTENERIFLPRNDWFFQNGDNSNVGEFNEAGLPNITGKFQFSHAQNGSASGAFQTNPAVSNFVGDKNSQANPAIDFDASRSSSIYGNSDTVQPPSVNLIPYMVVGNTVSDSSLTNVIDITTSENDTIPLGYSTYSGEVLSPRLGWLKSSGQWNSGEVYSTFYNQAVNNLGNAFAAGSIVEHTAEYTDYDLVINQEEQIFRLPVLDGSEDIPGETVSNFNLGPTGSSYTAPTNGIFLFRGNTTSFAYLRGISLGNSLAMGLSSSGYFRLYVPVKRGQQVVTDYSGTMTDVAFQFLHAVGAGDLYFKVGNAVQDLELLDVGKVMDEAVLKSSLVKVEVVVETYQNGTSWYRVWSDGWCVQGGRVPESVNDINVSVTFLKAYKDTNYYINLTSNTTKDIFNAAQPNWVNSRTKTGFSAHIDCYGAGTHDWLACGYIEV